MSGIADTYGFDWATLWSHQNNQTVRQTRVDPNVLMAGDQIFVPDKRVKQESCAPTRRHTFQIKGIPCRLNLCLLDSQGKPRPGLNYQLVVDGKTFKGTTGADGLISEVVPPNANKANLTVQVPDTGDEQYTLDLAYLNPVDYASGVQARLKNLGLFKPAISGNFDDDTADAISRFQDRIGLPVTGQADDATKQALLQSHGS
jgi:hypothetical protein